MRRGYWPFSGFFFIFCFSTLLGVGALDLNAAPTPKNPPVEMVVRLIYGTNKKSGSMDAELAKLVNTLNRDFGFLNYELKSSERFTLTYDETATKDLGENMIFIARNLGTYKGAKKKAWLELWFRDKRVFGAYTLFPKSCKPILIKGPDTNEGTYIILVSVIERDSEKKQPE